MRDRIISKALSLTALDRLVYLGNDKGIQADDAHTLSVALGYESFKDFIEKEFFNGASIPDGQIKNLSIPQLPKLPEEEVVLEEPTITEEEPTITEKEEVKPQEEVPLTKKERRSRKITMQPQGLPPIKKIDPSNARYQYL